ncbi:MAG: PQQ-like beta-propeller repeat protein [Deltaproteobacteria bacterium]|nr:PQQ-like beta-propeller repeat protein [Deltaproteobacteria bacterium]
MLILAIAAIASLAAPFATFRGDLQHTGVYAAPAITTQPHLKWKFETQARILGTPAIVGNTAYIGSADGNLYAIDLDTGALRWKFATEGLVVSSPAVSGDLVYFHSYDGTFRAVEAATGKLRWAFKTGGEKRFAAKHLHGLLPPDETMPDFWDFWLSSPAVDAGRVHFGSGDGNIYALDAATGALQWKFHTGDVVHASPAIWNGTVYLGSWDTFFYALDAATGKERWRFQTGRDPDIHNQEGIQGSAAIMDGVVYFGCRDATLYALDAATGAKKWSQHGDRGWRSSSPAVYEGRVYLATGSDKKFNAFDAKTGAIVYSFDVGGGTFASPAIAGRTLYLATFDNKLRGIDLDAQKESWVLEIGAPPKIAGGSRFYDDVVGIMTQRWAGGIFIGSPVPAGKLLLIGSTDGALYALEAR